MESFLVVFYVTAIFQWYFQNFRKRWSFEPLFTNDNPMLFPDVFSTFYLFCLAIFEPLCVHSPPDRLTQIHIYDEPFNHFSLDTQIHVTIEKQSGWCLHRCSIGIGTHLWANKKTIHSVSNRISVAVSPLQVPGLVTPWYEHVEATDEIWVSSEKDFDAVDHSGHTDAATTHKQ